MAQQGKQTSEEVTATEFGMTGERWPADWRGACATSCPPGHRRVQPGGWSICPAAGRTRNHAMANAAATVTTHRTP